VGSEQFVDLAGHLYVGIDEDDEEIANAFQISDEMRGEDDTHTLSSNDLHQSLEKFASGEGVEARYRLVQDEQLGPFGDCETECELCSLAT
jgi:hypothetical protein